MVRTDPMSESEALRDRLTAELEAAIAAAIEAAARDRHRPIAEVGPTDATALLVSVARVAHFNREYDAGARTVAKLTLPERSPLPTGAAHGSVAAEVPGKSNARLRRRRGRDAHPCRCAYRARTQRTPRRRTVVARFSRALRDRGRWCTRILDPRIRWLSFAVLFLSDLLVTYLATKRQRQPLYDLVAAWHRCPAKSLFETGNFRPEVLATATDVGQATATDVGQVSSLYLMSEEFMLVAKSELKNSDFLQRGRIRYSAGIFCPWPRTGVNVQASLVERRRRLLQGA